MAGSDVLLYGKGRFEGVRRKRMLAFLLDLFIILLLSSIAGLVVLLLGLITLGLGWLLFGAVCPAVAVLYWGSTIGGPAQGTLGMRAAGLMLQLEGGQRPTFVQGAAHGVLFYVSISFLTPFILLIAFFNPRKRLLHDIVLGAVVMNRPESLEVIQ